MKLRGLFEWLDDKLNPIVVKELRQAVQSKFVIVVMLLFLLAEVLLFGIFLVVENRPRGLASVDFQGGREIFAILHGIMLGTCLLFLPLYTGVRLAAERGFANMDLLFATTLPPRAIIGGKYLAALILALIIFSTCTPFLFFSYLLRGIDWPTILFVIGMDFLAVALGVMLMIWTAVVPGHWILKAILGMAGLWGLAMLYSGAMALTLGIFLRTGVGALAQSTIFWAAVWMVLIGALGVGALFYSWSVALISPPSANRALIPRLVFVFFWGVSLPLQIVWSNVIGQAEVRDEGAPLLGWMWAMGLLCAVHMVIAVNERESWSPRTARTIPKSWWLRGPALLLYSGAAGGLLLACLLFGLTMLVGELAFSSYQRLQMGMPPGGPFRTWDPWIIMMRMLLVIGLYTLAYALLAVLVRRAFPRIPTAYTWIVFIALVAIGSLVPFLVSVLLHFNTWHIQTHYGWLLTNPIAALVVLGEHRRGWEPIEAVFLTTPAIWALMMFLVNLPWFARQLRRFRPYSPSGVFPARQVLPAHLTEAEVATTRTL